MLHQRQMLEEKEKSTKQLELELQMEKEKATAAQSKVEKLRNIILEVVTSISSLDIEKESSSNENLVDDLKTKIENVFVSLGAKLDECKSLQNDRLSEIIATQKMAQELAEKIPNINKRKETPKTCKSMPRRFKRKHIMDITRRNEQEFYCVCGKAYKLRCALDKHVQSFAKHVQKQVFTSGKVNDCHIATTGSSRTVHKKDPKKMLCCTCGLKSSNERALQLHINRRRTGNNFRCQKCGLAKRDLHALRRHALDVHKTDMGTTGIGCGKCGRILKNRKQLLAHQNAKHS